MKTTITEALAEIKLISKKIEGKAPFVISNLTRYGHMPDPLGESKKALESEMQSYLDLGGRIIKIRRVISAANLSHEITIGERTMCIADWLIWKREVAKNQHELFDRIQSTLKQALDRNGLSPQAYKDADGNPKFAELITNLPYQEYFDRATKVQDQLAKLDGLLSLKNATITVEV